VLFQAYLLEMQEGVSSVFSFTFGYISVGSRGETFPY